LNHKDINKIAALYPELANSETRREALGEEMFATLFGLVNQQKAIDNYNAGFLTKMINSFAEFFKWLKNWTFHNLGVNLKTDDSLQSIINKAGDALLVSSYFDYNSNDFTKMQNLGIRVSMNSDLQNIKANLMEQGLINKIC
jgi:hypothetical protein